jgi:hypothetical protein
VLRTKEQVHSQHLLEPASVSDFPQLPTAIHVSRFFDATGFDVGPSIVSSYGGFLSAFWSVFALPRAHRVENFLH